MTCSGSASRTARSPASLLLPVDPERRHRVVLAVGAALGAVEHVIGRDVDQRNAGLGAGGGEIGRAGAVAGPGRLGLALGAVDRGVGGGVDDDVGPLARHRRRTPRRAR